MTGLFPGTEYVYRVVLDGKDLTGGDELFFQTIDSVPFNFLVIGDSGVGSEAQSRLAGQMIGERAKLLLHTGDVVYPTGTYNMYQSRYFDYYRAMMKSVPFFPCPGNHDYYDTRAVPYVNVHDLPTERVREDDYGKYYSFDWTNVHFVSLDSNESLQAAAGGWGEMLGWLDRDLALTKKFWRIVYFHHPPYASGQNENDSLSKIAKETIVPILEKHRVPLVLSGHEHSYQRTHPMWRGEVASDKYGTTYVTSGGGGAPLYPVFPRPYIAGGASAHHYLKCQVDGPKLTVRAIDPNGVELDRFTIQPAPVLAENSVVNAASFEPGVARGGLISIFGWQLAPDEMSPTGRQLPSDLGNVKMTINEQPMPLLMVSPTQINAIVPIGIEGEAIIRITTPNGRVEHRVSVLSVAPALFTEALFHAEGSQVSSEAPVKPGELVTVYATGLGAVEPEVAIDEPAPADMPVRTAVRVLVGGSVAEPAVAALAAGLSGVYKVSFVVPSTLRGNSWIRIEAAGLVSNEVPLWM